MRFNRRAFIQTTLAAGMGATASHSNAAHSNVDLEQLDRAAVSPILQLNDFEEPIIIQSIELYKVENDHIIRAVSTDGASGFAFTNTRLPFFLPILARLVIPYFIGKDARELESSIDGVYVYKSNYKLSGLALWNCVASVELCLLDLLGKLAGKHVSALFGGRVHDKIAMYAASGNRDTTPEEEANILQKMIEEHEVKAVKFKVGGRMSHNADSIPGRSEKLIPLVRKTLGDDIVIHADSNGSYDAAKGIEIGRMCQDQNFHFFEEPCPFDWLEETKQVADALDIPIAGGEQETSLRRFRWTIANDAVQVVQPDLHYNGGFIRATRVARMAALKGTPITVHMSGGGTGFVDVLNFSSFTPNIGAFQEYKGDLAKIGPWYDPPLEMKDGSVNIPTAPGMGLKSEEEFLEGAERVV